MPAPVSLPESGRTASNARDHAACAVSGAGEKNRELGCLPTRAVRALTAQPDPTLDSGRTIGERSEDDDDDDSGYCSPPEMYRRLCAVAGVKCNPLVDRQLTECCVVCARRAGGVSSCDDDHATGDKGCAQIGFVLSLQNNYVGLRGMMPLLRVVRRFDFVQRLLLDGAMLDSEGTVMLCDALSLPTRCLRVLALNRNPAVGARGGMALELFAARHFEVEEIQLADTGIPSQLLASIAETVLWHKVSRMLALGKSQREISVPGPFHLRLRSGLGLISARSNEEERGLLRGQYLVPSTSCDKPGVGKEEKVTGACRELCLIFDIALAEPFPPRHGMHALREVMMQHEP
jgi:hypothetical protein